MCTYVYIYIYIYVYIYIYTYMHTCIHIHIHIYIYIHRYLFTHTLNIYIYMYIHKYVYIQINSEYDSIGNHLEIGSSIQTWDWQLRSLTKPCWPSELVPRFPWKARRLKRKNSGVFDMFMTCLLTFNVANPNAPINRPFRDSKNATRRNGDGMGMSLRHLMLLVWHPLYLAEPLFMTVAMQVVQKWVGIDEKTCVIGVGSTQ